ncbi:MAG: ABC transporter substrate-binding protein [Anaerolineae bacterium]
MQTRLQRMRDRRRPRALCSLLLLICLALIASACALPRSTPPIIKIGMIAPFEGLYRPRGYAALYAVKLALKEHNAAGGVAGHLVELVALNDDGQPEEAAIQARKLSIDPDVMGVIGPFSRAGASAVAGPLGEAGLAWITPSTMADEVAWAHANAYRLCASDEALARALVSWAAGEPASGSGVTIVGEDAFAQALAGAAEAVGLAHQVAHTLTTSPDSGVLLLSGDAEQVAATLATLKSSSDARMAIGAGPEGMQEVTLKWAPEASEGTVWVTCLAPAQWPQAFVEAYTQMAGSPPTPEAALAYDAANILLEAIRWDIESNGSPQRERIVHALGATRWGGLNGVITFDASGSWQEAPAHLFRVRNGQRFIPLSP